MRMKFIGAMALALLLSAPFAGRADVSFAYQGRLLDEKGNVLANNNLNHSIKFSLYDQATGGEALWTCTRDVLLSANDGQFSVELSGNSVSGGTLGALFAANVNKTLYIGLTVGNEAEISPRQKIMTVPKALRAADCMAAKGNISVAGVSSAKVATISQAVSAGTLSTPGQLKCTSLAAGSLTVPNVVVGGAVEGKGVIPVGGIVVWSGAINDIPTGWALCNGQKVNGVQTPNLLDRFVVGVGSGYNLGDVGGEAAHTLSEAEMPKHRHSYSFTGGDLALAWSGDNDFYCQHNQYSKNKNAPWTDYAGGGQAHENRPPYYALCYIMRVR